MSNVDRPNGFRPVKTFSGAPVSSLIRTVGVADGTDIFLGDAIKLSSGLAAAVTAHADVVLGVAVGFGKVSAEGIPMGMFNPENLNLGSQYYDDSASTHTEWVCYYVPVNDVLFEAQFDGAPTTPVIGQGYGLTYTTGSTVTGVSAQEIDGDDVTDIDVQLVDFVRMPGNTPTIIHGRVLVKFDDAAFPNLIS